MYFFQFWGPEPQGATYFLYQSRSGPGGLSPWAQTQILLRGLYPFWGPMPGAFAHCNTHV
jgi:hypothetical protein